MEHGTPTTAQPRWVNLPFLGMVVILAVIFGLANDNLIIPLGVIIVVFYAHLSLRMTALDITIAMMVVQFVMGLLQTNYSLHPLWTGIGLTLVLGAKFLNWLFFAPLPDSPTNREEQSHQ